MPNSRTSTAASPAAARVVGGYELIRVVGRGGMATVYLARQAELDRLVALKELGGLRTAEPSFAKRFVREARVAGALSHPSIVTVHDFFEHDGTPYIAMEYVPGGTLRPHMSGITLAETAGVLESVLAGLAHAEQHGIVHRDLKPENLMVTSSGRVKITDYGIAKATGALQTGSFRTETGTTIGTPTYIAPEQAMAAEVGPWTDLYSLGVIVFEMLVGRTPFYDSDTPMSIVLRHVNEAIPPVSELRPDVDPEVSDWVGRLLVKDPSQRTQSAADAWDEFEDLAIGILGARWRDGSALVGLPPGDETAAWPLTGTTRGLSRSTGRRTTTTRALGRQAPPLDVPLGDTAMATAMPPREEREEPRARRRTPLAVLATMTLLAVVAGAAAFAGGGRDGGAPAGAASSAASRPALSAAPVPAAATASPAKPALDALQRSSARDEAALSAASSPSEQSSAAAALAADYENAAGQLPSGSDPGVGDALRQIAAAYRAGAAAAARGDDQGFKAAGASVDDGRQALDDALSGAPASVPAPAPQPPPPSSSSSSGSTGSSSGSGGSGGANENEPDENDNGD